MRCAAKAGDVRVVSRVMEPGHREVVSLHLLAGVALVFHESALYVLSVSSQNDTGQCHHIAGMGIVALELFIMQRLTGRTEIRALLSWWGNHTPGLYAVLSLAESSSQKWRLLSGQWCL